MGGIDIQAFVETYGLPGVIMAVQVLMIRAIVNYLKHQIDERFTDQKVHARQMADNTKTLERALDIVEGRHRG